MGPHEPYWRTNSSYSPPPSRWDFQLQPELQNGSINGAQHYGSSTSTNSKEGRSWVRGNQLYNPSYGSDGAGIFLSGSSDTSQGLQWTPPAIQEIRADDFESAARRGGTALGQSSFRTAMEGTSENPESGGSTSFRSDSSGSEPKSRSFHTRCSSFMSKPIHPVSFPGIGQASPDFPAGRSWSSAGSSSAADFADVSETFDSEPSDRFRSDGSRCGLCERLLSQRSPWGSRRIVRSGDMPVAGVLPCRHVFHAECLENTTPKARKSDPPCPVCLGPAGDESCPDQKVGQRTTASRPWGSCGQAGDCVEGTFQAPTRNAVVLLNRNRVRKSLSSKSGSYSSGCSKSGFVAGPSTKR